jgi:ubiquinone/menaquinone biosynthesis C-methylase UbiE
MGRQALIEPRFNYRIMVWMYNIADLFTTPGKQLDHFDIHPGHTVVDYGCGPGRYLKKASEMVGEKGRVYAADIHPMALEYARRRSTKNELQNIEFIKISDNSSRIPESSADRIYAIDMFHQVDEPEGFLRELHRIARSDCKLFIEDGHQPRKRTLRKASSSRFWKIVDQGDRWVQLSPLHK